MPVDRATKRLVALHRGPAPARQQAELVVEARRDLGGGHRLDWGRGELDGERYPVESRADLRDRRCVLRCEREARTRVGRTLDEQ
jgi:hypothetical protein